MASKLPQPSAENKPKNSVLLILTGILALGVFFIFRLIYLNEPAGNDESLYYYCGSKVLEWGKPYYDYYEMKPPMLFYSYGLAVLLAGFTVKGMHLASMFIGLISSALVFNLLRRKYSTDLAFSSSAIWLLAYSSPMVYGTYLMSEHFVILYFLMALQFVLYRDFKFRDLVLAGVFMGTALLVKQTAILFFPAWLVLLMVKSGKWKNLAGFSLGVLGICLINFVILVLSHTLDEAYYWLIQFPGEYISRNGLEEGLRNLKMFAYGILRIDFFYWLLAAVSIGFTMVSWKKKDHLFILLLFLGALISLVPGFRFYPQYWLSLVFVSALSLPVMFEKMNQLSRPWMWQSILLIGLLSQFYVRSDLYFPSTKNAGNKYMVGQHLERSKELSKYLKTVLNPNDDFLVLGAIPQLYIYTGKKASIRHVWTSMLSLQSPKNKAMQEEFMQTLNEKKPDLIVFSFSPYHWNLRDSDKDFLYNSTYRFVNLNYTKIGVMDLENGTIQTGSAATSLPERINTYAIYRKN